MKIHLKFEGQQEVCYTEVEEPHVSHGSLILQRRIQSGSYLFQLAYFTLISIWPMTTKIVLDRIIQVFKIIDHVKGLFQSRLSSPIGSNQ